MNEHLVESVLHPSCSYLQEVHDFNKLSIRFNDISNRVDKSSAVLTGGFSNLEGKDVLEGTVGSGGSTMLVVSAAVPVSFWATSSRAFSLIRTTASLGEGKLGILLADSKLGTHIIGVKEDRVHSQS